MVESPSCSIPCVASDSAPRNPPRSLPLNRPSDNLHPGEVHLCMGCTLALLRGFFPFFLAYLFLAWSGTGVLFKNDYEVADHTGIGAAPKTAAPQNTGEDADPLSTFWGTVYDPAADTGCTSTHRTPLTEHPGSPSTETPHHNEGRASDTVAVWSLQAHVQSDGPFLLELWRTVGDLLGRDTEATAQADAGTAQQLDYPKAEFQAPITGATMGRRDGKRPAQGREGQRGQRHGQSGRRAATVCGPGLARAIAALGLGGWTAYAGPSHATSCAVAVRSQVGGDGALFEASVLGFNASASHCGDPHQIRQRRGQVPHQAHSCTDKAAWYSQKGVVWPQKCACGARRVLEKVRTADHRGDRGSPSLGRSHSVSRPGLEHQCQGLGDEWPQDETDKHAYGTPSLDWAEPLLHSIYQAEDFRSDLLAGWHGALWRLAVNWDISDAEASFLGGVKFSNIFCEDYESRRSSEEPCSNTSAVALPAGPLWSIGATGNMDSSSGVEPLAISDFVWSREAAGVSLQGFSPDHEASEPACTFSLLGSVVYRAAFNRRELHRSCNREGSTEVSAASTITFKAARLYSPALPRRTPKVSFSSFMTFWCPAPDQLQRPQCYGTKLRPTCSANAVFAPVSSGQRSCIKHSQRMPPHTELRHVGFRPPPTHQQQHDTRTTVITTEESRHVGFRPPPGLPGDVSCPPSRTENHRVPPCLWQPPTSTLVDVQETPRFLPRDGSAPSQFPAHTRELRHVGFRPPPNTPWECTPSLSMRPYPESHGALCPIADASQCRRKQLADAVARFAVHLRHVGFRPPPTATDFPGAASTLLYPSAQDQPCILQATRRKPKSKASPAVHARLYSEPHVPSSTAPRYNPGPLPPHHQRAERTALITTGEDNDGRPYSSFDAVYEHRVLRSQIDWPEWRFVTNAISTSALPGNPTGRYMRYHVDGYPVPQVMLTPYRRFEARGSVVFDLRGIHLGIEVVDISPGATVAAVLPLLRKIPSFPQAYNALTTNLLRCQVNGAPATLSTVLKAEAEVILLTGTLGPLARRELASSSSQAQYRPSERPPTPPFLYNKRSPGDGAELDKFRLPL